MSSRSCPSPPATGTPARIAGAGFATTRVVTLARRPLRALKNLEHIVALDHGVEGTGREDEHNPTDYYVEIVGEVIEEDDNVLRVRSSATWWREEDGSIAVDQYSVERIVKAAIISRKKLR